MISIKNTLIEGMCNSVTFNNLVHEVGITLDNYSKYIRFGLATETENSTGIIYLTKGDDLDFQIIKLTHELSVIGL